MNNKFDFSTYLFLSKDKMIISVYKKNKFENIYEKEFLIDNQLNCIDYQESKIVGEIKSQFNSFFMRISLLIYLLINLLIYYFVFIYYFE